MNLILIGPPGAGKGTIAPYITSKLETPVISTGNILREAVANKTELGLEAKGYMDDGKLVPDELVINMLVERIGQDDCKKGFILDGFPRTIPQGEALDKVAKIDYALELDIADDVIESRMAGRRVCLKCGATFHIQHNPPKTENVCDVCGDALVIRKDDVAEVVRDRLKTYHAKTEPLTNYYKNQNKLRSINAVGDISEIAERAIKALEQ